MSDTAREADEIIAGGEGQELEQVKLARLEKELQRFNDALPYDRDRVIARTQGALKAGVTAYFEAGCGMILLHENEDVYTYTQIIEKYFPGVSINTANKWMKFARQMAAHPQFRTFIAERGGYSIGLTVLEAVSEENLQEFEETGLLNGLTREKIAGMSVRTLQKTLLRAREAQQQAVLKATDRVLGENVKLREQVDDLKVRVAAAESPSDAALTVIKAAERKILEGFGLLARLPHEVMVDSEIVRNVLFGLCGLGSRVIANLETEVALCIPEAAAREEEEHEG